MLYTTSCRSVWRPDISKYGSWKTLEALLPGSENWNFMKGFPEGYESVFSREQKENNEPEPWLATASLSTRDTSSINTPLIIGEAEPNNYYTKSNELASGAIINGKIQPLGESDYYVLDIGGDTTAALTMNLKGFPHIRTSLKLFDESYQLLRQFDPGLVPDQENRFYLARRTGKEICSGCGASILFRSYLEYE